MNFCCTFYHTVTNQILMVWLSDPEGVLRGGRGWYKVILYEYLLNYELFGIEGSDFLSPVNTGKPLHDVDTYSNSKQVVLISVYRF